MDDLFTKRVRSAAVAGWWALLIVYCILLIQWFAYMLIMAKQPAAVLCIWGAGWYMAGNSYDLAVGNGGI